MPTLLSNTIREVSGSVLTGKFLNECLKKYPRFQLIHMVAQRVNELQQGSKPLVDTKDAPSIEIALEEIALGLLVSKSTAWDAEDDEPGEETDA